MPSQKLNWLDGFWKAALLRKGATDLLQGTALEKMSKELGFWAFRLDNVFEKDVHAELARKMALAFDPNAGGVSETLYRKGATSKGKHFYKVLNMCKHPCTCADKYGGITNHTIYQWGQGQSEEAPLRGLGVDVYRPKPPTVIEELVQKATDGLVQGVAGMQRQTVKDVAKQRQYEEVSQFYVVANRYENDTAAGEHTDFSPLYALHPQTQVVMSVNMVADGILWCPDLERPRPKGDGEQVDRVGLEQLRMQSRRQGQEVNVPETQVCVADLLPAELRCGHGRHVPGKHDPLD